MKKIALFVTIAALVAQANLTAHCQLPCGIYHDEMVFDEVDQYVETMYKGISVMLENKFDTILQKNQYIRWAINKEESSDGIARRFCEYFLQQKIKPGDDPETDAKVKSVHKMLFLLVQIKQNVDLEMVKKFSEEWDRFKLMFHGKDYECTIDTKKFNEEKAKYDEAKMKGTLPAPDNKTPANQDIKTMVPKPPTK